MQLSSLLPCCQRFELSCFFSLTRLFHSVMCLHVALQVEKSVVWVWPDSGLEALAESSKTAGAMHPDVAIPGFAEGEWELVGTPYMRDVPLRYDTLMENVVDPSHVPFSHHGWVRQGRLVCEGSWHVDPEVLHQWS